MAKNNSSRYNNDVGSALVAKLGLDLELLDLLLPVASISSRPPPPLVLLAAESARLILISKTEKFGFRLFFGFGPLFFCEMEKVHPPLLNFSQDVHLLLSCSKRTHLSFFSLQKSQLRLLILERRVFAWMRWFLEVLELGRSSCADPIKEGTFDCL